MRKNILLFISVIAVIGIFITVFQIETVKKKNIPSEQKISNTATSTEKIIQSVYTHPSPAFSFGYPDGFSAGSFPDGETGETILIHGAKEENNIQILISSFDEDIALTKERILKDAPDIVVKNEQGITIGKNAKGLAFESTSFSGPTREIWFVYEGYLYQITAPMGSNEMFDGIIKTWNWKSKSVNSSQ